MLDDKKAIIFDLDGTLVDSMWMWQDIDIAYLGRHGHSLPPGLQQEIEGMSFTETAVYFKQRFGIKESIERIQQDWLLMARDKYLHETPLKEGAAELVREALRRGIRLGIASSNSSELVRDILRVHELEQAFSSVHTCCDVAKGKPAPDIYLLVAEELKASPRECLVFEDIPAGILSGKNAGMEVCAVWDANSTAQEAEKRGLADYYIHTFREVLDGSYERMG